MSGKSKVFEPRRSTLFTTSVAGTSGGSSAIRRASSALTSAAGSFAATLPAPLGHGADVGHEQERVGGACRLERARVHAPPELRAGAVEAGRVEEGELGVLPVHDPEQHVSGGLGQSRDDGEVLAERRVQERRFADVRAADDGDGAETHGVRGGGRRLFSRIAAESRPEVAARTPRD